MEHDQIPIRGSKSGIHTVELESFEDVSKLISEVHFLNRPSFIFRGHRDPSWRLETSLAREIRKMLKHYNPNEVGKKIASHLENFIYALRGTLAFQPRHQQIIDLIQDREHIRKVMEHADVDLRFAIYELWSLGRHHGLLTPILDWSYSPYVALHFAFEKADNRKDGEENRALYALNMEKVKELCNDASHEGSRIDFFSPLLHKNERLIRQSGLFTYSQDHIPIEDWVMENYEGKPKEPILFRILIRNKKRGNCLRWLNRMNINRKTLFPELEGISHYCNHKLLDELF